MNVLIMFPGYNPEFQGKRCTGRIYQGLKDYGHKVKIITHQKELIKNCHSDCLILYHLTISTGISCILYKLLNRQGNLIVKLDNDGRIWELSVPLFFKIWRFFLGQTKIVPHIVAWLANHIICEFPSSRERILKIYPFFEKKMVVIPIGVNQNLDKVKIPRVKRVKQILFVGKRSYRKGYDRLYNAYNEIRAKHPLSCAGWRIRCTNNETTEQLASLYAQSEIVCVPSRHESIGAVLIEASWFGCCVLSSATGAANDILGGGDCGIVFYCDGAFKEHLKWLVNNKSIRRELGRNAQRRVKRLYDWEKIMIDIDRLIVGDIR